MIHTALPLSEHALLTTQECAETVERVLGLRNLWMRRSSLGFHTLGPNAYIDGASDRALYQKIAEPSNRLLLAAFKDIYDHIIDFLERFLGEDVVLDTDRAVPGFHIFELVGTYRGNDDPGTRAHFDLQWQTAYPDHRPDGVLSFTLPLSLPDVGGGLALWPRHYGASPPGTFDPRTYTGIRDYEVIPYALGQMIIHDGLMLHAIASAGGDRPIGYRITLQGHAIRVQGQWRVYW